MKSYHIEPHLLSGSVTPPPSKSLAHRAILCAALANGVSVVDGVSDSDDMKATLGAVVAMGGSYKKLDEQSVEIDGRGTFTKTEMCIDCNESGSTLRFLIPLVLAKGANVKFIGRGQLGARPLDPYYPIFDACGVKYKNESQGGNLDFQVEGRITSGNYKLPGNISSQFITGLLLTLPLAEGDSVLTITGDLESKSYLDLTLDVLHSFGIVVRNEEYKRFLIPGNQQYIAQNYTVESDYSQAAFFLCAAAIGNPIKTLNMNPNSRQGDRAVCKWLRALGYAVHEETDGFSVIPENPQGTEISGAQCPDIIPELAVVCALTPGKSKIIDSSRLRIKECDRLKATTELIQTLGGNITETEDGFEIEGVEEFTGGQISSFADHRIAMTGAIAATRCNGLVILDDSDCVKKSYPTFWEEYRRLGGIFHE